MSAELFVISIPYRDPVAAFAAFADDPPAVFFDSADEGGGRGRYSYIAADPFRVITADIKVEIDGHAVSGDPFGALRRELARFTIRSRPDLPPFQTGAAGFFAYELGRHLERLPAPPPNDTRFPEMAVGLYDTIAAFDIHERRAWVMAGDLAENDRTVPPRPSSKARGEAMAARIEAAGESGEIDMVSSGCWRSEMTRRDYELAAAKVIEYILAGDIFQANLTQRFLGKIPDGLHPFTLYRRLRKLSPAPFAAYLACGHNRAIASASPERFLRLGSDGEVETRPIKGTRPRGKSPDEDAELAALLLASEKDHAENLMIVDLLRNDLSRVCEPGSVKAEEIAALESFANVHHLVSVVRGQMRKGLGAVDLLEAAFPGGSVTGAPKIRAMEIIAELEPSRRGPYCGAIAWMGFDGAMESSVVIRSLTISDGMAIAQAGGGIVADSDPSAEYDETIIKVRALLDSLGPAEFG